MNTESRTTRRQFLKEAGLVAGSAAIGSLTLLSGCKPSSTESTIPVSSSVTQDTIYTVPVIETSGLPPAEGFVYKAPSDPPPVMKIPGCTTNAALDRKYIMEHMWVKMVAQDVVVTGITEKMAALISFLYELSLPAEGIQLKRGENYIYAHGAKLSLDFPNPVSGVVLQKNNEIYTELTMTVIGDPYNRGWFNTVKLSNPEEWDELLTPQQYADLNTKVL